MHRLHAGHFCALAGALCVLAAARPAPAQDEPWPPEVLAAVRNGQLELLESRFAEPRSVEQLRLLARAAASRARNSQEATEQGRALATASRYYAQCIAALASATPGGAANDVQLAGVRVEYGQLLLAVAAGPELDQLELSGGRQGDREKLHATLAQASEQLVAAAELIEPLYRTLDQREDDLLAAGIYDRVIELHRQIAFGRAWVNYYAALVTAAGDTSRGELLAAAERFFRELVESTRADSLRTASRLGLGIVLREQKRYQDAEPLLRQLLEDNTEVGLSAQARCELARLLLQTNRFEEARAVIRPLLQTQPPTATATVKFYANLARLLDAGSYLEEAQALRARGGSDQAQRVRQKGLEKFRELAALGGPWPAVVQLYLAADQSGDPDTPGLLQSLLRARELIEHQGYREARQMLAEAAARLQPGAGTEPRRRDEQQTAGEILMELGRCCYLLGDLESAAEAFERLARDYRAHELAPQAVTLTVQLRARIAQKSQKSQDYELLAETLLNLLQNYPDHPERAEAAWLYPVALQAAGQYEKAEMEFAKLPAENPHYAEAQWRRLMCRAAALRNRRERLSERDYRQQAVALSHQLLECAKQLRAEQAPTAKEATDSATTRSEAYLLAAELLVEPGVEEYPQALAALEELDRYRAEAAGSPQALALRLRALCGLRRFEELPPTLQRYLQAEAAEKSIPVLSLVAATIQDEVGRLQQAGRSKEAAQLAAQAEQALRHLEELLGREPAGAGATAHVVRLARGKMLLAAGQLEVARQIAEGLCRSDPGNGEYRLLLALVLTAVAEARPDPEQFQAARTAWEQLLWDPELRRRAPQRYWEARYHQLALLLKQGHAREVDYAIGQELVWNEELGGPPWREKLLELRQQAQKLAAEQPAGP